jgi:hypothetical protein
MHPIYRRVKQKDVEALRLHKLDYKNNKAVIGAFSNIYHWNQAEQGPEDFRTPPIVG